MGNLVIKLPNSCDQLWLTPTENRSHRKMFNGIYGTGKREIIVELLTATHTALWSCRVISNTNFACEQAPVGRAERELASSEVVQSFVNRLSPFSLPTPSPTSLFFLFAPSSTREPVYRLTLI